MNKLANKIFWAMLYGAIFGLLLKFLPIDWNLNKYLVDGVLQVGGTIFINLMKMLVVPLVLISIICGICSLEDIKKLGRLGTKTIIVFLLTTVVGIIIAMFFAHLFNIGMSVQLPATNNFVPEAVPSFKQFIIDIFPSNPIKAMADGNVLQVIVFAVLFGLSINLTGEIGKRIGAFFQDLNAIMMKFIMLLMQFAPIGIFCLIAILFADKGFGLILGLFNYTLLVIAVLLIQVLVVYGILLKMAKLSPKIFLKKMYSAIIFAFSVASSNASIPLTLETVVDKLGVSNSVAAFLIPLGVNINKNGTAIMQAIAAIFIANVYQIHLGFVGNLMLLLTTTLVSIGTAGAPGIGLITLVMILKQLGLPMEGMALIIGVYRIIDMARTAINVAGNAVAACLVGKLEGQIDYNTFYESK